LPHIQERGKSELRNKSEGSGVSPEAICVEELKLFHARDKVAEKIARAWQKSGPGKSLSEYEGYERDELPHVPVARLRYWVVDVETTGCRAGDDRIIEVAAVEVANLQIGRRFSSLLRPDIPLPSFISRLTGITDEMLSRAPSASAVLPLFFRLIRGGVFVAHPASFDWKFIAEEFTRLFPGPLQMPRVCTLRLARRLLPALPDHKLDTLAGHYRLRFAKGGSANARHRALGDAMVTARIFIRFMRELKPAGVTRFQDLKGFENLTLRKAWKMIA
jgi:DNA polymerase III epsilon subunit family exonuclease